MWHSTIDGALGDHRRYHHVIFFSQSLSSINYIFDCPLPSVSLDPSRSKMASALPALQQNLASVLAAARDQDLSALPDDVRNSLIETSQAITCSLQKPSERIFGTIASAVIIRPDPPQMLCHFLLIISIVGSKYSNSDLRRPQCLFAAVFQIFLHRF